jgi:hypothetical protein
MSVIAELDLIISKVDSARTQHECVYCKRIIKTKEHYMKFTVRHKRERFARNMAVCNLHKPELIPLSVIL